MAPTFLQILTGITVVVSALSTVRAESHTITFANECGRGTPTLVINGQIVSTGQPYTSDGTISGIAYLQTGECLLNGENCTLMEMTLDNPTCPGCGSSADISLIPPHKFNVATSFSFYNGCDGVGRTCSSATCNTAFFKSDDNQVQSSCQNDNVNLRITFCGSAAADPATTSATASPAVTPSKPAVASSDPATKVTSSHATALASQSAPPQNVVSAPPHVGTSASTSSNAPTPSQSTGNGRKSCKNKRTTTLPQARSESEVEARKIYNLHNRRLARRRASGSFGDSF